MDVVLKAYATLLNYFANSSNIPHNTEIDTEIEEMLLTPIQRINETVNGISHTHPLDRRNMVTPGTCRMDKELYILFTGISE